MAGLNDKALGCCRDSGLFAEGQGHCRACSTSSASWASPPLRRLLSRLHNLPYWPWHVALCCLGVGEPGLQIGISSTLRIPAWPWAFSFAMTTQLQAELAVEEKRALFLLGDVFLAWLLGRRAGSGHAPSSWPLV